MKFKTSKGFGWDIQETVPRYYQVTGRCFPAGSGSSPCSGRRVLMTIMASDLGEVCQKVRDRGLNLTIEQIIQFKKPALVKDDTGQNDLNYKDVTPEAGDCQECCDLIGGNTGSKVPLPEARITPAAEPVWPRKQSVPRVRETIRPTLLGLSNAASYEYWGSGVLTAYGTGTVDAADLGVFTESLGVDSAVVGEELLVAFTTAPAEPLPQATGTVLTACSAAELPIALEIKHGLDRVKALADFLKANGLTLPGVLKPGAENLDFVKITYSARTDLWQGTLHYAGQSPSGGSETWDIGFQFGCATGGWKFSLTLARTRQGRRALSRMLAYFADEQVVPADALQGFAFTVDVKLLTSDPPPAQPVVVNDDAGFFRNLRLPFRLLPQNLGTGPHQYMFDESGAFASTLTGG
jgi:hypothetical protein